MSFDLLAPHYRWLEFLTAGGKLQRCRTRFLEVAGEARNILILGEGNGRFLAELLGNTGADGITVVDASARMIALARRRAGRLRGGRLRIRWLQRDVLEGMPDGGPFDLVVTHFFLDCFRRDQLERLIDSVAEHTSPGARWLLADFREPREGWSRLRARLILGLMYPFFRLTASLPADWLTPPDAMLERAGFRLRQRAVCEWGLLHSDCWVRAGAEADLI